MARKTVVIEFVVEDEDNQPEKRERVRSAVETKSSKLREALVALGWSGNPRSLAVTVSNPKRTADWPI